MYTPKENFIRFMQGKSYEWKPLMNDRKNFHPAILPEYVARGFVAQQEPFPAENYGGKDWFGVNWYYDPVARGSMETGPHLLEDISEWEDKIVFPDLDAIDWAGCAAANAAYLDTDQLLTCTIYTGFFERLISFMGFENAAMALIDEEQQEDVHRLFDKLADFYVAYIHRLHKYFGIGYIVFHDDWGTQRSLMFSRETHAEMIAPYVRRVIEAVHAEGMVYEQHSCGLVRDLIPNMIEMGADTWIGQPIPEQDKDILIPLYGDKIRFGVVITGAGPMEDAAAVSLVRKTLERYHDKDVWFLLDKRAFPPEQQEMLYQICVAESGKAPAAN